MKKAILFMALISVLLMTAGCSKGDSTKAAGSSAGVVSSQASQSSQQSQAIQSMQPTGSYSVFYDPNPQFVTNIINVNPTKVYYENGLLVMQAFVTNGFSHPVFNISINQLTLSNKQGVIASASFGLLQGVRINANENVIWTFTFPADCIKIQNADLSTLKTESSFHNDY